MEHTNVKKARKYEREKKLKETTKEIRRSTANKVTKKSCESAALTSRLSQGRRINMNLFKFNSNSNKQKCLFLHFISVSTINKMRSKNICGFCFGFDFV